MIDFAKRGEEMEATKERKNIALDYCLHIWKALPNWSLVLLAPSLDKDS